MCVVPLGSRRLAQIRQDDLVAEVAPVGSRSTVVVVTGVPGAGKTTLAGVLAAALGSPVLSLDAIKERRYASAGTGQDRFALRLAAETELLALLRDTECHVVVDIWVAPRRDTERVTGLFQQLGRPAVEVLCRVPAAVAASRYERRARSVGPHLPADEATLQRIRDAVDVIEPMGVGHCVEVDTSGPVDIPWLIDQLDL